MRLCLVLTLLLTSLSLTTSMYSDQVGINDRSQFHTGPLQSVYGIGSRTGGGGGGFLLSSNAGVIARINQRTGDKQWRVVLPDGKYLW